MPLAFLHASLVLVVAPFLIVQCDLIEEDVFMAKLPLKESEMAEVSLLVLHDVTVLKLLLLYCCYVVAVVVVMLLWLLLWCCGCCYVAVVVVMLLWLLLCCCGCCYVAVVVVMLLWLLLCGCGCCYGAVVVVMLLWWWLSGEFSSSNEDVLQIPSPLSSWCKNLMMCFCMWCLGPCSITDHFIFPSLVPLFTHTLHVSLLHLYLVTL